MTTAMQQIKKLSDKTTLAALFFVFCFLQSQKINAQELPNYNIEGLLPKVVSPSPTVSNLMKFEEVPVNKYSGIPDVKVPIHSVSKGEITFDFSLAYHPLNINANQRSSDVGLGWSLIAGGTVSRTVRGLPDEMLDYGGSITEGRVGIYHNTVTNYTNNYYQVKEIMEESYYDFTTLNEFIWEANVNGKYDTEHDLYQYNFLGYSGRFYIKKENGQLVVVKLDVNPLKITNHYNGSDFSHNSFEIVDDNGNRYVFDIIENSTVHYSSESAPSKTINNGPVFTVGDTYGYKSAFHLSKVYDKNDVLIANFIYSAQAIKESTIDGSITRNHCTEALGIIGFETNVVNTTAHGEFNPLPISHLSIVQNSTLVKKLERIEIIGKAKIDFTFSVGRTDTNIHNASEASKLSQIIIKDWSGQQVKKLELVQGASTALHTRMILNKVKEYGNSSAFFEYNFVYKAPLSGITYSKDAWGYLSINQDYVSTYSNAYPDKEHCMTDVLEKMTLPTGGEVVFEYEPNTYSYIGDSEITDFDANPDNWIFDNASESFNTISNNRIFFFEITEAQSVLLTANNDFGSSGITEWLFKLYKFENNNYIEVPGLANLDYNVVNLEPGSYYVEFNSLGYIPIGNPYYNAQVTAHFKVRRSGMGGFQTQKFLYGGGIRIKNIKYFNALSETSVSAEKETHFRYHFFENNNQSSGSLAYPVPLYRYSKYKRECATLRDDNDAVIYSFDFTLPYNVTTTFNNLAALKTKGTDVGYKNVTVTETNNGKTTYVYTSPIDYPEQITSNNTEPPFLPPTNIDFKRGLLLRETNYDQSGKKLKEVENQYSFDQYTETYGIKVFNTSDLNFVNYNRFGTYGQYINFITSNCDTSLIPSEQCNQILYYNSLPAGTRCNCFCYYSYPGNFIMQEFLKESYGWAKLDQSLSRDYSYQGGVLAGVLEKNSTFTYDPYNQKIKTQTTSTSAGEVLTTNYFYPHNAEMAGEPHAVTLVQRNAVSTALKTEVFRSSVKLFEQKTVFKDWGAGFLAPELIQTSKGPDAVETRVQFNAVDTANGNPLEVQQEGGSPISYIWGYNLTQPVAKVENMGYDSIPSGLISAIHSAATESAMLSALTALRTHSALATAQVTTYTHLPLVGIKTITDPKGYTTTYHYDNFNRLEKVTDMENNILSENQYRYRTQN